MKKIIAIGGQTASGKSSIAVQLAKEFNGEIINADSRQIYRLLNIGTAKDPIESYNNDGTVNIDGVRHHLIDILNPEDDFNLALYKKLATEAISEIIGNKKIPIIVGGTGLYLDAVIYNYDLVEEQIDQSLRESLRQNSLEELQAMLIKEDSEVYASLTQSDKKNPQRLIRSIERLRSGVKINQKNTSKYDFLYLGVTQPIPVLNKRIDERVDKMMEQGLEKENLNLREMGYSSEQTSLSSIGYKEFNDLINGTNTIDQTKELIALHTKQYAKRQLTWFKRNTDLKWVSSYQQSLPLVKKFLQRK